MYIPITLFVLKCAANSLMGLKVCKLLGTRQKKLKLQFLHDFFKNGIKSIDSP